MDSNQRFLLKTFRKYYRANTPFLPDRFTRREFGFMFFDKTFVQRHIGFHSSDELHRFMESQVPSHSYYSTAYYRTPDAPTMEEKGWMGAELIFDLDADHLANAESMTYDEMLVQIRSEMISLVDDYLMGDLGFSEDQIHICFSGGRGYHAHVRTDEIYTLGTNERRELVDYITCMGLDMEWAFPMRSDPIGQVGRGNGMVQ
jgi:DNA primase small subunit